MLENKDWLKPQILRSYLSGLSQEQIAIEFDISEGTVSAFLQESRELDDTLLLQHEVAVVCNKYNIPIQQLAANLAFSNAAKKMGFDNNKIDLLLHVLNKMLVEDGSFSPEKIANLILQICNFIEVNGVSLEETHSEIEEKSRQLSELKKDIKETKKFIVETEESRKQVLRQRRMTIGELRRFTICRKAFEYAGIDFSNIKQFVNVLNVIRELDGNPDKIIDEMKKTSVLEFRKFLLEKDCDEREKNLQIYEKKEQERISYNDSYNVAVDLVNRTLVKGVTADEIVSVFDTTIKNNLSIPDFIKDIDTYGGIKSAIFKTKRELEKLNREQDLIDSEQGPHFI